MEIFYVLLVLLLCTRIFGEIAANLRQPPLVGELVAGICLGLIVADRAETFPLLAELTDDRVFVALTDLGMFFLMLLAGVEMSPSELAKSSKRAFFVAIGGMAVPFAAGALAGWILLPESDLKIAQTLFIAVALSITAVPVVVRVLMDIGQGNTDMGKMIVSAAIFDDILSLALLAVLTGVIETGSFPGLGGFAALGGRVLLFFAIAFVVGRYVFPPLGRRISRPKAEEFEFSALIIGALGFAVLAELLDLHFIVGAFMAGLFFGRQTVGTTTYNATKAKVAALTTGFLGPIFFASIGLHLDMSAVTVIPWIVALLVGLAFVTKIIGSSIPAYLGGLGKRDAMGVGIGMSARGAVELIIADIALRAGLFDVPDPPPPVVKYLFSTIVIVAVVTTLATPVFLQLLYKRGNAAPPERPGQPRSKTAKQPEKAEKAIKANPDTESNEDPYEEERGKSFRTSHNVLDEDER